MHSVDTSSQGVVRQRVGKKKTTAEPKMDPQEAKKKLEKAAIDMAKGHQAEEKSKKSKKFAEKLTSAGVGQFNASDFDAKSIKENFPDAWEKARQEVASMGDDPDALDSLLDTVE